MVSTCESQTCTRETDVQAVTENALEPTRTHPDAICGQFNQQSQREEIMEKLHSDLSFKIFRLLDHPSLASAQQVCRNWKVLASDNVLWCNLFEERWGKERATFYAPLDHKSWKDVYEVQDRCDRVGLGLKIIREAGDYYLVHQGVIQRYLGSRDYTESLNGPTNLKRAFIGERPLKRKEPCASILDKILFFIGDLEVASNNAKRNRVL